MLNKLHEVLSLFSPERREITALEAVELLGRPKSTVYRLLTKIHEAGFLDRNEITGAYRLGIHLAALGELARQSTARQRLALPVLRRLSERTAETADFTVLVAGDAVTIEVVESYQPIMLPGLLGAHVPLHATAAGKALLSWRDCSEVEAMLKQPLEHYTDTTITDISRLHEDLERSRERHFTLADGEWVEDLVSLGAPVRNHRGMVESAVAVGGPRGRMTEAKRKEMARAVQDAADELSRALGFSGPRSLRPLATGPVKAGGAVAVRDQRFR